MKHRKRIFVTIFAVALVLCLALTACKSHASDLPTEGNTVSAETPDTGVPAPSFTSDDGRDGTMSETETKSEMDYYKAYDGIIAEWKSAFEKATDEGVPYSGDLSFDFYSMDDLTSAKAFYAVYDIDGNGMPELILRKENGYEDIIAYIFAIKDGNAVNIFGYDEEGHPREVPWSRVGSSAVLSNGLIDCMSGDYSIYRIADDGYSVTKVASSKPYDYPDEAGLAEAKWRYYIDNTQVDYDGYIQYLDTQGYTTNGLAMMDWETVD